MLSGILTTGVKEPHCQDEIEVVCVSIANMGGIITPSICVIVLHFVNESMKLIAHTNAMATQLALVTYISHVYNITPVDVMIFIEHCVQVIPILHGQGLSKTFLTKDRARKGKYHITHKDYKLKTNDKHCIRKWYQADIRLILSTLKAGPTEAGQPNKADAKLIIFLQP